MEFLNFHHLRYFWVAAKEGGLTRAAVKLHVSQPTICTQIQALESMLGEKLLRRRGQGLALTEAGQQVFSFAEEIFSLGDDLLNTVKQRPTLRPLRVNLRCDWMICGCPGAWKKGDPNAKGYNLEIHVWGDAGINVDKDKIPEGMAIQRSRSTEQRAERHPPQER